MNQKFTDYYETYMLMHEEDLIRVARRRSILTEGAQLALNEALSKRSINLHECGADHASGVTEEDEIIISHNKRYSKKFLIFIVCFLPGLFLAMRDGGEVFFESIRQTFIRSVMLGAVIIVFSLIFKFIVKFIKNKLNNRHKDY